MHPTLKARNKPYKSTYLSDHILKTSKNKEPESPPTVLSNSIPEDPTTPSNELDITIEDKSTPRKFTKNYSSKKSNISLKPNLFRKFRIHASNIVKDPEQAVCSDYYSGIYINEDYKKLNFDKSCSISYVLKGNTNSVNCVNSHMGKIWSGGSDCTVRSWEIPIKSLDSFLSINYGSKQIFTNNVIVGRHKKTVKALGKCAGLIVTASADGITKLWSSSNSLQHTFKGAAGIKCLKSLSDQKLITAGSELNFWDIEKCEILRDSIATKTITCIEKHTNNTYITGSESSVLYLWDLRTPRSISSFVGHSDSITGVTRSSGFTMLSCSDDCSLKEWDFRNFKLISTRKSSKAIKNILIKGNYIITGGDGIGIWTSDTHQEINTHGSIKDLYYCTQTDLIYTAGWNELITAWSFNSYFK
jgi:WD domain, G-beta repeat